MTQHCSFCGDLNHPKDLQNTSNTKSTVIVKLREAFKVDIDSSKFPEICTTCEEKVDLCHEFYQQILKNQQSHACFIKEEVQERTAVKVEVELDDYQVEIPAFFESFTDTCDQISTNNESEDDQKQRTDTISPFAGDRNFSSRGRRIKAPNLFSVPTKVKVKVLPQPGRPTDRPAAPVPGPLKKKSVPRSKRSRGVRAPKAETMTMLSIFDDEIKKKKFYDKTETLGGLEEKPRLWSDYSWTCTECDTNLENIYDLNTHMRNWHSKKYESECIECLKTTQNFGVCVNHAISHHPQLKFCCHICSKHHKTLVDLYHHQQKAHKNHKIMFCIYCGYHALTGAALQEHVIFKHNRVSDRIQKFYCDICGFEGLTKAHIFSHMKKHKMRTLHQCDKCEKSYFQQFSLRRHIFEEHSDAEPKEVCSECGRGFMTYSCLKKHVEKSHLKLKKFSCEICKRRFGCRATLKGHMYTHDKTAVGDIQCPMCPRKFKRRPALEYHINVHTGEKPFLCSVEDCEYRSVSFSNTLKHIKLVHKSDLKPIKVPSKAHK